MPYNGAVTLLNFKERKWDFMAVSSPDRPRTVSQFVSAFKRKTGKTARIAWNGGYILNPELVGKLGLPETYIGSPLGLLISGGIMSSPPLFNKPALLVHQDGSIRIQRVSCKNGLHVSWKGRRLVFDRQAYNNPLARAAYFDLMHKEEQIDGDGKTIIRLSGNVVKEILETRTGEKVNVIPVGLTLALEPEDFPHGLIPGERLQLMVPGMEGCGRISVRHH